MQEAHIPLAQVYGSSEKGKAMSKGVLRTLRMVALVPYGGLTLLG